MFLDLFYGLRAEGVPIALQEWMTLMEALRRGLHGSSLLRFYHLARAVLVKSETYFDAFDRVFARVFHGVEGAFDVTDQVLEWLRDPKNFPALSPDELAALERLSADELMQRFLETVARQTERHDGGEGVAWLSDDVADGQAEIAQEVHGRSPNATRQRVLYTPSTIRRSRSAASPRACSAF